MASEQDPRRTYGIAFVGAGPTTMYCLDAILKRKELPAAITIFERQRRAGQGTPYSPNWSDPVMLANIASVEIPPLPQSLVEWLHEQSDDSLASIEVARDEIHERAFYPRLVLGEYLAEQFRRLIERGRALGIEMHVKTRSNVVDVRIAKDAVELEVDCPGRAREKFSADYVILATGHQWPPDPETRPGYFTSPWPASALARIRNCAVGVRGTSLSAIDAAVVVASQHGEFVATDDGLDYVPNADADNFSITFFSRKGLLPEADFFHPIPYEPLAIFTPEAIERLIEHSPREKLLDEAFELFRRELLHCDPSYGADLELQTSNMEAFCAAYFARRSDADPFEWAAKNLEEAIANAAREYTVPWRYAILRMHEVIALVVPHLNDADFVRFSRVFKPVFVDDYATVPHESIKRLLALRARGRLSIERLDLNARLDVHTRETGAVFRRGQTERHFPAFIEATGQPLLSAKDFPFPSLRRQGVVQDVEAAGGASGQRGIALDQDFHPVGSWQSSGRLFCLSLPYLLGTHPFAQGITSSAEMGEIVAHAIEEAGKTRRAHSAVEELAATQA